MTTQARCACGCYVAPCKGCGRIPGQEGEADLMDYRATPARQARIDRRISQLFGVRSRVDRFIDSMTEVQHGGE